MSPGLTYGPLVGIVLTTITEIALAIIRPSFNSVLIAVACGLCLIIAISFAYTTRIQRRQAELLAQEAERYRQATDKLHAILRTLPSSDQ